MPFYSAFLEMCFLSSDSPLASWFCPCVSLFCLLEPLFPHVSPAPPPPHRNEEELPWCCVSCLKYGYFFLRSAKNILTNKALKYIYYSNVHGHLIDGIQMWSCTTPCLHNDLITKHIMSSVLFPSKIQCSHWKYVTKFWKLQISNLFVFLKLQFVQRWEQGIIS